MEQSGFLKGFLIFLLCLIGLFLIIALIFSIYPQSVLSIWIEIPIAIAIGWWCRTRGRSLLVPSILALLALYGSVWLGVRFPIELNVLLDIPIDGRAATGFFDGLGNFIAWFGTLQHYESFEKGLINPVGLIYAGGLTVFFLVLNNIFVEGRKY